MAPIAPGALAESASAKMRFLYSAEYWRRLALTTTSGSGIVLASPGATLRSAALRSASLRSAPREAKTTEGGGTERKRTRLNSRHRDLHSFPTRRSSDLASFWPHLALRYVRRRFARPHSAPHQARPKRQKVVERRLRTSS